MIRNILEWVVLLYGCGVIGEATTSTINSKPLSWPTVLRIIAWPYYLTRNIRSLRQQWKAKDPENATEPERVTIGGVVIAEGWIACTFCYITMVLCFGLLGGLLGRIF